MEGWGEGNFGMGANPITRSGAILVSLAALNSHFSGLLCFPSPNAFFLSPSLLFFCYSFQYIYIFIYIFVYFRSHSCHTPPFPQLHDFLGCMKACIGLCHQQSIKACHPSCVMLRSAGSLKHPTSSVSLTMLCIILLRRGCSQRSPHTSALPLETKAVNG